MLVGEDVLGVDIVLATYNGEKYLAQQLNSLVSQSYQNWRLIISDDGSTDTTALILAEFARKDSRVSIVNLQRQGGVVKNFAKALSFVKADYIMFCDQDDVWANEKVAVMLNRLIEIERKLGLSVPILGFSDATIVSHDLSLISHSLYGGNNLNAQNNLEYRFLLWRSTVFGCTVIFNSALYQKAMPIPFDAPMHDQWFALIASLCGEIFFIPKQTLMYRMHEFNVVGAKPKSLFQKISSIKKNINNVKIDIQLCGNQIELIRNLTLKESVSRNNRSDYDCNRVVGRLHFLFECVLPFWKERTVYVLLFSFLFLLKDTIQIKQNA
jgi:glycosyltransferase involved in cell wall biosynthesis